MRASALVALLAVAACLRPGSSPYGTLDTTPPFIAGARPPIFGNPDGGAAWLAARDASVELFFNEELDRSSLAGAISVTGPDGGGEAVRLVPSVAHAMEWDPDFCDGSEFLDGCWRVTVIAERAFAPGAHVLHVATSLRDFQGNALPADATGAFHVP